MSKYLLLTKPGIIMGNVLTTGAGFAIASHGRFDALLFLKTLLGLTLIIASACVFNNYIDREADKKMARTKDRPLAEGSISHRNALLFATVLGLSGVFCLGYYVNFLAMWVGLFGFLVYVLMYSFSKYRTTHATLIGSIAGAVPPIVGYVAAGQRLDGGAAILFLILVMWQMPHFFAIAMYRIEDYRKASIPVLPLKKGIPVTKIQMFLYILAFIAVSSLLTAFHYVGYAYLAVTLCAGLSWLIQSVKGFKCSNDKLWGRKMFLLSLVAITGICTIIPISLFYGI